MNVIRMVGVPCGTKCSNIWCVFQIHPTNINLTHNGKDSVSVSVRCLVLAKMYENSPRKLFIRTVRNSDVSMNEFPLFLFPFPKIVFISWHSLFIKIFIVILLRDGINKILQILVETSISPIIVLCNLVGDYCFVLLDQKLRIDLSFSIYFVSDDGSVVFFFVFLFGD
jgi:hypothetical protein